ncbi:MAG: tetratricopeptide repeat protein [Gemmatimonadetes bacterium]|nr:tetratricopeptide repeat protein [Gemmatimonadota bacterium]
MRSSSGMMLMLAGTLSLGGCAAAAAGSGAAAPAAGPGRGAAQAERARETDLSRRAELLLVQVKPDSALLLAQQGLLADSTNALYHAIAGEAQATRGDVAAAEASFRTALRLAPGSREAIETRRETAWKRLYNRGIATYRTNDVDATVATWEKANAIHPDAHHESYLNLAVLYTGKGDYDRAVQAYRSALAVLDKPASGTPTAEEMKERSEARAAIRESLGEILLYTEKYADAEKLYRDQLARDSTNVATRSSLAAAIAAQPGREPEAAAMYDRLLSMRNLRVSDYQDIGVALFTAKSYARSAEAFARVTQARPNSREALYNHANALYAGQQWAALLPVAQRLVAADPLYEDSWLILIKAQRETGRPQQALRSAEAIDAMPIRVKDLTARVAEGRTTVRGTAVGNAAPAGSQVRLRFTFYGADGEQLGAPTTAVTAPAKDATTSFQVVLENPATVSGYKYEVVR